MAKSPPIYLDNLSTTPLDPRVREEFTAALQHHYANAGNLTHALGRAARQAVESARARIAKSIGARAEDIVFTAGATESNNVAILGTAAKRARNRAVVTCVTEHSSVIEPCRHLARRHGFKIEFLRVDREGRFDRKALETSLARRPALLSLMLVNNEIGTVHDLTVAGQFARRYHVPFHCDAAQAVGKVDVDVRNLPVDFLSFSGHKIYGPKGIGGLYVRGGAERIGRKLAPILFGGGQESSLRPGTHNVPAIVAFAKACELARGEGVSGAGGMRQMTESLFENLATNIAGIVRLSPTSGSAPGILNVAFPGVDAETLLSIVPRLALSLGSACHVDSQSPSHVLKAIGTPQDLLFSAVRFGLGRFTTGAELNTAVREIARGVRYLRKIGAR